MVSILHHSAFEFRTTKCVKIILKKPEKYRNRLWSANLRQAAILNVLYSFIQCATIKYRHFTTILTPLKIRTQI